jgi:uncharacterized repeat protein (TIGR01451 family)
LTEVDLMSRQNVLKVSLLALALTLLAFWQAAMVGAAPPKAPALGITVTPTPPESTPTPTPPESTPTPRAPCEPIIRKQVSPGVVQPDDEVVFTITVINVGQEAAVDARVLDAVPDYLEILEVHVIPKDQGQEILPRAGQTVVVDVGTLGQDYEVTVLIRARLRADAPAQVCVENVAEFRAPNCPDRAAEVLCWQLPESGRMNTLLTTVGVLATIVLVLSLALSKRKHA